jgi:dCTP deaminase
MEQNQDPLSDGTLSLFPEIEERLRTPYSTGVLPAQKIEELINAGRISASAPMESSQIQPASLDLRLGPVAYRTRASFLPSRASTVTRSISELGAHKIDLTKPYVLERGCVYIVPLMEELNLPSQIYGKANPKSTIGRLDIFSRLIADYGTAFERVPPGYKGKLYVEIVPRTFSVIVQQGTRLNQLRLVRGMSPYSDAKLVELHEEQILAYLEDNLPAEVVILKGLWISINLQGENDHDIIGYKAKKHTPPIDLAKENFYEPLEYWEPIVNSGTNQIILDPEEFYLLMSKERVRIPPDYAAELVAYDPSFGEFTIHYAGFFDPGFGYGNNNIQGTHAVLEVRSHEVPFLLRDGQVIGRFIFERLLATPEKIYGTEIGSSYSVIKFFVLDVLPI